MSYDSVAKVTALYYYPIKSCRGIAVTEAECSSNGVKYDRHWAILDRGGIVTRMSSRPELACVVPTMLENSMKVEAPGMEPLILPLSLESDSEEDQQHFDVKFRGLEGTALHVSNDADEWFSRYLGKPHTLVMYGPSCKPRRLQQHAKYGVLPLVRGSDSVAFAECCPLLLISEDSLEIVNERCSKFQCDVQRFRPNIVISGADAFAEDTWKFIKIGDAVFRCVTKCGRCLLPNVDPFTGVKDKDEPMKTLKEFRKVSAEEKAIYGESPILGCNLGTDVDGVIRVGDIVSVMRINEYNDSQ